MKKVLALFAAIIMATPAFAAVQNVKVSGDIDSTYVNRNNFNLGALNTFGGTPLTASLEHQSVFITQTRVRIDADLSDNVSTTVGLINERAWDAVATNSNGGDNVDLYLAYATMREFLYSPLTVTVGRQIFNYGNGLIIGDGGVNNSATGNLATVANDLTKRTAYDGVKAVLDYKPLTLDMFYFKNTSSGTNTGNMISGGDESTSDDSDVFGLNANYQLGDEMNTAVEGYLFARLNGKANSTTGSATAVKGDKLYIPGLRVSTNPIKGLNAQAEIAWQTGNKAVNGTSAPTAGDNLRREAMAYQFMTSYVLPVAEQYKPIVNASYTHVSGDSRSNVDGDAISPRTRDDFNAWDPLNEAQGSGTIYNTLFNLTNMNIIAAGLTVTPIEDVTAKVNWSNLRADKRYTNGSTSDNPLNLLQADGSSAFAPTTTTRKELGNEYDVNVDYAYTEDVTFGVSLGWFVPGKAFDGLNDDVAKQALAHVNVNF